MTDVHKRLLKQQLDEGLKDTVSKIGSDLKQGVKKKMKSIEKRMKGDRKMMDEKLKEITENIKELNKMLMQTPRFVEMDVKNMKTQLDDMKLKIRGMIKLNNDNIRIQPEYTDRVLDTYKP